MCLATCISSCDVWVLSSKKIIIGKSSVCYFKFINWFEWVFNKRVAAQSQKNQLKVYVISNKLNTHLTSPSKHEMFSRRNFIYFFLVHSLSSAIWKSVFMILIYNFFLIFVLNLLKSLLVTLTLKFKSILRRFWKDCFINCFYLRFIYK